jgi:hypothetical protein
MRAVSVENARGNTLFRFAQRPGALAREINVS